MKQAVANATVLILLAEINKLDLLHIYNPFLTTPQIRAEVLEGRAIPVKEKNDLEQFFSRNIKVETATQNLTLDLGVGETSALSLCVEKKISIFLSDDKKARKTADTLSAKAVGTIGIILENLNQKKITKQEAKKTLQLVVLHSYIQTDLYVSAIELIESFK